MMMICLTDEVTHEHYGNGRVTDVNPPFVTVAFYKGKTRIIAKIDLKHRSDSDE